MHVFAELYPIREASRKMVRGLGILDPLAKLELPLSQCHALIELERVGATTVNGLAQELLIDPSVASRIVTFLVRKGWVAVSEDSQDKRKKLVSLTPVGVKKMSQVHEASNAPVIAALKLLSPPEREAVLKGLRIYGNALEKAALGDGLSIRPIQAEDDPQVTQLIKTVMTEIGASGPGFSISDPEVLAMSENYRAPEAGFLVLVRDRQIVGCGGFAPLTDGGKGVCELRKMYFYPEVRGLGKAQEMLGEIMEMARAAGYTKMYLETITGATKARALYERNGFVEVGGPCGNTGHGSCDRFYAREL